VSNFSQVFGVMVHQFLSGLSGLAVLVAVGRALKRATVRSVGSFWVDLTCGLLYFVIPLSVIWAIPLAWQVVTRDGKIIGSALLAQQFQGTNYFWPRPSACTYGTGPSGLVASSGSNLGPTSGQLQTNVMNNTAAFISGNSLPTNTVVPADMAFASASGLDPHISPEAAQLQTPPGRLQFGH
jgi:K+-transporting ATPase ATPase C chain